MRFHKAPLGVALSISLLACANSAKPGTGDGGDAGSGLTLIDAGLYLLDVLPSASPTPSCDPHAELPSNFTDTTLAWNIPAGLSDCQAAFSTADLDGDGYPDLIFYGGHGCGLTPRETIPSASGGGLHNLPDGGLVQYVGVWFNRPNPEGGRMFVDGTQASGLLQIRGDDGGGLYRSLGGVAIGDVNNDGTPDVVAIVDSDSTVLDGGFDQSFHSDVTEIALNDGTGRFRFAPQSDPSTTMQMSNEAGTLTDIDNDGKLDLFLSYWYPVFGTTDFGSQPQLYHGEGDGSFSAMTDSSGSNGDKGLVCGKDTLADLLAGTTPRPSFSVTACDLNQDGYDDLIIGSYGGQSNELYQNDGTGHFFRVYQDGGIDADDDFDYSQNAYYLCYCSAAGEHKTKYCADAGTPTIQCPTPVSSDWSPGLEDQPALLGGNNFSIACRDMNGDGINDVYVTTIRHWWAGPGTDPSTLLLNDTATYGGPIAMERVPNSVSNIVYPHLDPQGWNEGVQHVALADFDNDGRPDVLAGVADYSYQYGTIFIQQSDGGFLEKGPDWNFHVPCAGFVSVADLDRDGDLDIVTTGSLWRTCASSNPASGGGPGWPALKNPADGGVLDPGFGGYDSYGIHVYSNNAGEHSSWLALRLRGDGTTTNGMGIGARVTVTVNGVAQMQEMASNYGLTTEGNDVGVLFFGLGNCATVDSIEVRWPNQSLTTDHYTDVPSGHLLELHEGDPTVYGVVLGSGVSRIGR